MGSQPIIVRVLISKETWKKSVIDRVEDYLEIHPRPLRMSPEEFDKDFIEFLGYRLADD